MPFALKMTIVTAAGTSFSGLVTAPSNDYAATERYREALRNEGVRNVTLVDGQTMWDVPAEVTAKAVIGYEIVDPTPAPIDGIA